MNYMPYICKEQKLEAILLSISAYILAGILIFALLLQLYYLLFVYGKMTFHKVAVPIDPEHARPVSLIICARDEEENLRKNLPLILDQDYPEFEVIVVNDCSTDDSEWVLKEMQKQYDHLRIVHLKEHLIRKHGKKFAVTMGIKAANHEHLIFTDADCWPASSLWLKGMAQAFTGKTEIVLGYSPYQKYKGILNAMIRFETFHTAMSYLSYALKGNAYMGVGRNMAYLKSLFFKGKGFAAHMHIPSGDDDLFVNQNATSDNTHISIHPDAHIWSLPKTSLRTYFRQKTRHHGAARLYRTSHKWMLSIQLLSAVVFYISWVLCMFIVPEYKFLWLGILIFRWIVQFLMYGPIMRKLQVRDLLLWLPLLDLFYYIYIVLNGFVAFFTRNVKWK